jgi:hypothetical protein
MLHGAFLKEEEEAQLMNFLENKKNHNQFHYIIR